jgi:3-demethylubiquinone-9 3-methyltransferase
MLHGLQEAHRPDGGECSFSRSCAEQQHIIDKGIPTTGLRESPRGLGVTVGATLRRWQARTPEPARRSDQPVSATGCAVRREERRLPRKSAWPSWLEGSIHSQQESEMVSKNTICLWFDGTAADAAQFYAKTFPDSSVGAVCRAPGDYPDGKQGDVLTVEFTVIGIPCLGLNGGPAFKHNEAFSFQVATDDQAETDRSRVEAACWRAPA